jgi:hypothetical protein
LVFEDEAVEHFLGVRLLKKDQEPDFDDLQKRYPNVMNDSAYMLCKEQCFQRISKSLFHVGEFCLAEFSEDGSIISHAADAECWKATSVNSSPD